MRTKNIPCEVPLLKKVIKLLVNRIVTLNIRSELTPKASSNLTDIFISYSKDCGVVRIEFKIYSNNYLFRSNVIGTSYSIGHFNLRTWCIDQAPSTYIFKLCKALYKELI